MFLPSYFSIFLCVITCLSLTLHKKLQNLPKNVSITRMDEKKLHTREFQLKGIGGNMGYKSCFKKGLLENNRVFQTLVTYRHWKRYLFRTYQMHFSNISKVYKVSYSKNTLFLLQNYVTPRPQQNCPPTV